MRILVVEDDVLLQQAFKMQFDEHAVSAVESGELALKALKRVPYSIMFLDIRLKGHLTGVDVLREVRRLDPLLPVIMTSGLEDRATIVECLELGAVDYAVKGTVNPSAYQFMIHKAAVWRRNLAEKAAHRPVEGKDLDESFSIIRGSSNATTQLKERISTVGRTDGPFLIQGETGTGKELVARSIWAAVGDQKRPFITVNCAEFQNSTIESELFGYEKGAFTGALQQKIGIFEAAHGGDIFLDEIGELPLEFQAKLLRVIQERKIRRMGSNFEREFEFRVIAATNRDLASQAHVGTFRQDLYYRLDVHSLTLTPLRNRPEDIPELLSFFFERQNRASIRIDQDVLNVLSEFRWPGNVRQLEAFVKFTIPLTCAVDPRLTMDQWVAWSNKLSSSLPVGENVDSNVSVATLIAQGGFNYDQVTEATRHQYVAVAMELAKQSRTEAAKMLGVTRQRLSGWLSEMGK